jgi:prepilin-type N-terminal cleavage/methylation domain-containing protein
MGDVMDEIAAGRPDAGYSLLETLAVVAIIGILIGIVAAGGVKWDRAERERASEREIRDAVCAAREAALAKGTTAWFRYGTAADGRGVFSVETAADGLLGATGRLARGVGFAPSAGRASFGRDGRGLDSDPPWTNGVHGLALTRSGGTNAPAVMCRINIEALTGAIEVRRE